MLITIIPPLAVNTAMGFLLFTSHSFFSLELARMSFFRRHYHPDAYLDHLAGVEEEDGEEDPINLQTLISGPRIIPNHPTLLSGLAGAGAGLVQGAAFTPIENIVRYVPLPSSPAPLPCCPVGPFCSQSQCYSYTSPTLHLLCRSRHTKLK